MTKKEKDYKKSLEQQKNTGKNIQVRKKLGKSKY